MVCCCSCCYRICLYFVLIVCSRLLIDVYFSACVCLSWFCVCSYLDVIVVILVFCVVFLPLLYLLFLSDAIDLFWFVFALPACLLMCRCLACVMLLVFLMFLLVCCCRVFAAFKLDCRTCLWFALFSAVVVWFVFCCCCMVCFCSC